MVDTEQLTRALSDLDVSNVFVYVGDAVRDDYVSAEIASAGSHVRTVAASTHSPTSFASLVTGRHPPRHGVSSFSDRLTDDTPRLFDLDGIDARFLNSIFEYATEEHGHDVDPIYSVLNAEIPEPDDPFEGLDSPFVAVERGPGGHAPYGEFDGAATEYFHRRSADGADAMRADYRRSVELDADLFSDRLDRLAELGLRDDTLVVYTSDHGELLGEGGMVGHNSPMRPELVYVPTVFVHPDLPELTVTDSSFHHVDLFPTVCDVLDAGEEWAATADGRSLAERVERSPRPCFWENRFLPERTPLVSGRLRYEGAWDSEGGRVFSESGLLDRLAVFGGKLFDSSKRAYMRRHPVAGLRSYVRGDAEYGQPGFGTEAAREVIAESEQRGVDSRDIELSDDARSHLQDLGYMN